MHACVLIENLSFFFCIPTLVFYARKENYDEGKSVAVS